MAAFLLRVEGVNLSSFVEDTQDLSTIRGGSLMLLDSVDFVGDCLKSEVDRKGGSSVECLSRGASTGLFRFELPRDRADTGAEVRAAVERALLADATLKHATFVVDVIEETPGEFRRDSEHLIALNRFRQMRAPSLALPRCEAGAAGPCRIDKVRPAAGTITKGAASLPASASVRLRRGHGILEKQRFYARRAAAPPEVCFVTDFEELTHDSQGPRGNLHHKMAVLYADGNDFSKKQTRMCLDAATQKHWDAEVRGKREALLAQLLALARREHRRWTYRGDFQLETLLWGGDDLMWVVPAWQGWAVASLFFAGASGWAVAGEPLTHAAGLVFCHHNAPIHRITRLARALAGLAKEKDRTRNLLAYQVLESFDDLGLEQDMTRLLRKRYAAGGSLSDLIVDAERLDGVVKPMVALRERLPRSRLVSLVLALQRGSPAAHEHETRLLAALDSQTTNHLGELKACFGEPPALWFHMVELWDYVAA